MTPRQTEEYALAMHRLRKSAVRQPAALTIETKEHVADLVAALKETQVSALVITIVNQGGEQVRASWFNGELVKLDGVSKGKAAAKSLKSLPGPT